MTRASRTFLAATVLASLLAACAPKDGAAVETRTADGRLVSGPADSASHGKTSMIRIINALPGMNSVTVTADANALFTGVDYKAVTPYTEVRDNIARFRLKNDRRDTTVATNSELLTDGSHYTIVALPERDGGVRLRVLHDELVPDAGKARIRVIHGIAGAGDIAVTMQGVDDALFGKVDFGSEAGYKEIDPRKGNLEIREEGNGRLLLRKELKIVAGHAYTVVVAGDGSKRVDAIVIDDQALPANR